MTSHGIGIKRAYDDRNRSVGSVDCSCCHQDGAECNKRLRSEATIHNKDGQTCLHLLCQDRCCPVDDVIALIDSNPGALKRKDMYGRSPLFYALRRDCSIEVVKVLFDSYPDAILEKDFCGVTPLYLLFHSSKDYRILQYALEQQPSLALYKENSFSGQTLFQRICAPWTSKQLALTRSEVLETNPALKDRWTKLVLIVRAAHAHTIGHEPRADNPELHLALELPCCPPMVLCHFAEMYPAQASILMATKRCFPLHYYLSTCGSTRDTESVIKCLIKAHPDAVKRDYNGRLPLHLALSKGLTWHTGIRDIIFSSPGVLDQKDPDSGLIPFLQAASGDYCDLSAVYSILSEDPAVIGNLI